MELSFLKEGISLIVKEQGGKKKKEQGGNIRWASIKYSIGYIVREMRGYFSFDSLHFLYAWKAKLKECW